MVIPGDSLSLSLEPKPDKTNKMTCAPSEDLDHPRRPPSLIHSRCLGWSESSLSAHLILLVLSWGGSFFVSFSVCPWLSVFVWSVEQIRRVFHDNFAYFSIKTYVVGTHWNCLGEAIPVSTHNIYVFMENWRKLSFSYHQIPSLSFPLFGIGWWSSAGKKLCSWLSTCAIHDDILGVCASLPYEPWHDKTDKMSVHPAKTQISLGIRPVWSESSMPSLIRVFAVRSMGS